MKYLRLGAAILIASFGAGAAQATVIDPTTVEPSPPMFVTFSGTLASQPGTSYSRSFIAPPLINPFNPSGLFTPPSPGSIASYDFNISGVLNGRDVVAALFRSVAAIYTDFDNFHIDPNTVTVTQVVQPASQTWTLSAGSGAKLIFKNGAYLLDFGNVLTDSSNSALLNIANNSAPVDGETLNGGFFAPKYEGEFGLDFRLNLPQSPFDIGGGRNSNFAFGFETAGLATGDYYSTALLDTSQYLFGDAVTGDTFTPVLIHVRVVDVLPVAGVPEPAAWTMMIAGFGLVGSALRRRVRQVA